MCMGGGGGQALPSSAVPAPMNPLQIVQDRVNRSDYHYAGAKGTAALAEAGAFVASRDAAAALASQNGKKASTGGAWKGTTIAPDYSNSGLQIPLEAS